MDFHVISGALQHCPDTEVASRLFRILAGTKPSKSAGAYQHGYDIPGGLDTDTVAATRKQAVELTAWAVANATTADGLDAHIGDTRKAVREAMAANPNCSASAQRWLLQRAITDHDRDLFELLLNNDGVDPNLVVDELVGTGKWGKVASVNRITPFFDRDDLSDDLFLRIVADRIDGHHDTMSAQVAGIAIGKLVNRGHQHQVRDLWTRTYTAPRATSGFDADEMFTAVTVAMLATVDIFDVDTARTLNTLYTGFADWNGVAWADNAHLLRNTHRRVVSSQVHMQLVTREAVEHLDTSTGNDPASLVVSVFGHVPCDDEPWMARRQLDLMCSRAGGSTDRYLCQEMLVSAAERLETITDPAAGRHLKTCIDHLVESSSGGGRAITEARQYAVHSLGRSLGLFGRHVRPIHARGADDMEQLRSALMVPRLVTLVSAIDADTMAELVVSLESRLTGRSHSRDFIGALALVVDDDYLQRFISRLNAIATNSTISELEQRIRWDRLTSGRQRSLYRLLSQAQIRLDLMVEVLTERFAHRPDAVVAAIQMAASSFSGTIDELADVIDLLHPDTTPRPTPVGADVGQQLALL